jgi:hypothetical protein
MDSTTLLILVVVVLVAIVGWLMFERRRMDTLRSKFWPEYRRTVEATGDRREAEAELQARERRNRRGRPGGPASIAFELRDGASPPEGG